MVDLALLLSVRYIAGALGVCVATVFYVLNLRETTKNRKIILTTTMMQPFNTARAQHEDDESYDYEVYQRTGEVA